MCQRRHWRGRDGGFPSQGRTSFAILPIKRCFSVKRGRGRKLLPLIGKDNAVLLRPCQDSSGGLLVLERPRTNPFQVRTWSIDRSHCAFGESIDNKNVGDGDLTHRADPTPSGAQLFAIVRNVWIGRQIGSDFKQNTISLKLFCYFC
jgi:hypothetical protein